MTRRGRGEGSATWTERDQKILDAWRNYDDETFITEISLANLEHLWDERNEFDVDVPPDSMRGAVLALYDEMDRVMAALPWPLRLLSRVWMRWHRWRR